MYDIESQFDLRGDSKDLISKQINLLKEAGELIGESFFTAQIDGTPKTRGKTVLDKEFITIESKNCIYQQNL